MELQIFIAAALLAGCGTDPSAEDVGDPSDTSDVGGDSDSIDVITTPDVESDLPTDSARDSGLDVDRDAGPDVMGDADQDAPIDVGEGAVRAQGWYSTSFEHAGFIREGEVNPVSFAPGCNPYFVPLEDLEQWWTMAPLATALAMHPGQHSNGWVRAGLIDAEGTVTEADPTDHMGEYDRDFTLESSTVLACETAAAMPHCMTPRTGDLCFEGVEIYGDTRRHELVEVLAGPIGSSQRFELRVITGEDVGDGRTDIVLEFDVDRPDFEPEDGRFVYVPSGLDVSLAMIEFHGFAYVEVPFELSTDAGWLVADRSDPSIEFSLDMIREDGNSTRVWGDFAITDTLALP